MTFRDPNTDPLKEGQHLINARKNKCTIPGCDNLLTAYQGPGSDTMCREHQLLDKDYGGLAKTQKIHSFSRKKYCEACGFEPYNDPRLLEISDPVIRNQAIRSILDVDHMDGDHDNNHPENLQTLCKICHGIKTIVNSDYRKRT